MNYYNTKRNFFIPVIDINNNIISKLDRFLSLLEKSGVCDLIKNELNSKDLGGRPNYNPYDLLAVILYCFAFSKASLRDIEENCKYDLRVIYLMNNEIPTYKTIGNFINKIIIPNRVKIHALITSQIFNECNLKMENAYIDGTKIEADANKYKFVWKPTKFHEKLTIKIRDLLSKYDLCRGLPNEDCISSKTVAEKLCEFYSKNENNLYNKQIKNDMQTLSEYLNKILEYEEKERICGPNRKSYYKTDNDATAMCLKADYYSKIGSNMHAAYNVQINVINGLIVTVLVTQSRTDINDFIPLMNRYYEMYGTFPIAICADAGYGSLDNYKYISDRKITNYIKHQSWEGNVSGKNPARYKLLDDNSIKCLNGNIGYISNDSTHLRNKNYIKFKILGCFNCNFKYYCKKFMKEKDENYRYFEVNVELQKSIQEAEKNLLSTKGIEMRVNRSSQVEGAFGVIKQDMNYDRFRRTSLEKVETEFLLISLGYNIRKLFKYFDNNNCFKYWIAPTNLIEEKFKKPSYKRLTNKIKKGIVKT